MNRIILLSLLLTLISFNTMAQGVSVVKGFDGGMIRVHLGEHWRVGSEGYVSTLQQANNGSYVKFGWGGLLGDYYWQAGCFMPYDGLTIGGGAKRKI